MSKTEEETPAVGRLVGEGKLPSGRTFKMREIRGKDELAALVEAGDGSGRDVQARVQWGLLMRSVVSIDGAAIEPTTPESFRDGFSSKDWIALSNAFDKLHNLEEAELATFRDGFRIGG